MERDVGIRSGDRDVREDDDVCDTGKDQLLSRTQETSLPIYSRTRSGWLVTGQIPHAPHDGQGSLPARPQLPLLSTCLVAVSHETPSGHGLIPNFHWVIGNVPSTLQWKLTQHPKETRCCRIDQFTHPFREKPP